MSVKKPRPVFPIKTEVQELRDLQQTLAKTKTAARKLRSLQQTLAKTKTAVKQLRSRLQILAPTPIAPRGSKVLPWWSRGLARSPQQRLLARRKIAAYDLRSLRQTLAQTKTAIKEWKSRQQRLRPLAPSKIAVQELRSLQQTLAKTTTAIKEWRSLQQTFAPRQIVVQDLRYLRSLRQTLAQTKTAIKEWRDLQQRPLAKTAAQKLRELRELRSLQQTLAQTKTAIKEWRDLQQTLVKTIIRIQEWRSLQQTFAPRKTAAPELRSLQQTLAQTKTVIKEWRSLQQRQRPLAPRQTAARKLRSLQQTLAKTKTAVKEWRSLQQTLFKTVVKQRRSRQRTLAPTPIAPRGSKVLPKVNDFSAISDQRRLAFDQLLTAFVKSAKPIHKIHIFIKRWKIFLYRASKYKSLIYPTFSDSFLWPKLPKARKWSFTLRPKLIWEAHVLQSHVLYSLADELSECYSEMPFIGDTTEFSPIRTASGNMLHHLFSEWLWYHPVFFQKTAIDELPTNFLPSFRNDPWLKMFFRPTWDTFDQDIKQEHCFDDYVFTRNLWTEFLLVAYPSINKSIADTFLVQFVEREYNFWAKLFRGFVSRPKASLKNRVIEYFKTYFPLIRGNPTWTLYLLERLPFILPFLPTPQRTLFYLFLRILRTHCRVHRWRKQKKLKKAKKKASFSYQRKALLSWFKRQGSYLMSLKRPLVSKSLFQASLKNFRSTLVYPWISVYHQPLIRLLKQRFTPRFSTSVKKKFKRYQALTKKSKSRHVAASSDIVFQGHYSTSWSLLLLWSLVFYLKLRAPQPLFLLSQWLLTRNEFNLGVSNDSLKCLYDSFLYKFSSADSLFKVACAHWISAGVTGASRQVIRQRHLRRFFTSSYIPKKESAAVMYHRFQYLRQLPFSSFVDLWPSLSFHSWSLERSTSPATPVMVLTLPRMSSPYGSRQQLPLGDPSLVVSCHRFATPPKKRSVFSAGRKAPKKN